MWWDVAHGVAREHLGQVGDDAVVERLVHAHERGAAGRGLDVDHGVVVPSTAAFSDSLSCLMTVLTCGALTSSGAILRNAS